jgi:N-acetylneuraminate lyase
VTEFLFGAEDRIPTLAGLKFSDEDLTAFGRTVDAYGDRYDLFFGVDELLLHALALGAKAAIGSTYNFAATLYTRMIDAFRRGDTDVARACNKQARELAWIIRNHGGIPAMKATIRWAGVDCGPCRLPLWTLTNQEVELLESALEDYASVIRPGRSANP